MTDKKTVLVTGSNAGIGFIVAKLAAMDGARVILACRNPDKAEAARQQILKQDTDAEVLFRQLDLSSFESIRQFAEAINREFPVLDALVNNAGVFPLQEEYTKDGFEMQFGVNYLGHFMLTHLLLPLLIKAPNSRIVHVSSIGHMMGRIRFNRFRGGRKLYLWGVPAYGQSKLANVLFSNELVHRLPSHVTTNAVHPGYVDSEFFRSIPKFIYGILKKFLVSAELSGKFIKDMALSREWDGRTGEFVPSQGPLPISSKTKDRQLSLKLYDESCRLTGVPPIDLSVAQQQNAVHSA